MSHSIIHQQAAMTISPWPQGQGFATVHAWWEQIPNDEEQQKLDQLIGRALLDQGFCDRLLTDRDEALLSGAGLSKDTQVWLRSIHAATLTEFAQAISSRLDGLSSLSLATSEAA